MPEKVPKLSMNKRLDIVEEHVDTAQKAIAEIKDWQGQMTVLDERTKQMAADSIKYSNAIFGTNGIKGVLARMESLEEKMTNLKDKMDDLKKFGWAIMIAAVGIFLELMVQLLLSHGTALAK